MPAPPASRLTLERIGDVTIVSFLDRDFVEDATINPIRDEVKALITAGHRRFVLNMDKARRVSTFFFALFASLNEKLGKSGGGVKIYGLDSHLVEGIKIMGLGLETYAEEQAAIDAFGR